jgi:hypothetical protein
MREQDDRELESRESAETKFDEAVEERSRRSAKRPPSGSPILPLPRRRTTPAN